MGIEVVGIVDYHGQVHCMEHACQVGSYEREVYSVDAHTECWCGKGLGRPEPEGVGHYVHMNDGVRGRREPTLGYIINSSALRRRGI